MTTRATATHPTTRTVAERAVATQATSNGDVGRHNVTQDRRRPEQRRQEQRRPEQRRLEQRRLEQRKRRRPTRPWPVGLDTLPARCVGYRVPGWCSVNVMDSVPCASRCPSAVPRGTATAKQLGGCSQDVVDPVQGS
jgi:hypothetical protein